MHYHVEAKALTGVIKWHY